MKILSVVGARPQLVKAAVVSRELRPAHQEVLVHTGQHYDYLLSEVFFRELGLPQPDYNLEVGSASHGRQTAEMLARLEEVLLKEMPCGVVVYGDTNSTLAGALAAAKLGLPVAHVEAGMRSYDRTMPEEINRVLTDHISDLLFCASETAVRNLAREGITQGVHYTGDVMYDAFRRHLPEARARSKILATLGLRPGQYLLATVHRAANTDDREALRAIVEGLGALGEVVVFPMHPRTRKALEEANLKLGPKVRDIEPVGYLDMLVLEENARMIITDSGGVQKEAYFVGVPCVTLREETEWPETVAAGWNRLVGADPARLWAAVRDFRPPPGQRPPLFGDGRAAAKIAALLAAWGGGP